MSFRIKLTDPSLRQDIPEPKPASFTSNLFGFSKQEEKKSYSNFPTNPSRPKEGSDKGLAIRQVPSAQADHM